MISLDPDNAWTDWTSWSECSRSCGEGIRTRLRACENPTYGFCPGLTGSDEVESCNEGSCPTWSKWSEWGDCSADCDTGIQTRTRTCLNGLEDDCAGSSQEDDFCNRHSCGEPSKLYYWTEYGMGSWDWRNIDEQFLPNGETFTDRCLSYCLSRPDCITAAVTEGYYRNRGQKGFYKSWKCDVTQSFNGDMFDTTRKAYLMGKEWEKNVYYVTKDFYEANQSKFKHQPTGDVEVNVDTDAGLCDGAVTAFGPVDYRNTKGTKIISSVPKNVITESKHLLIEDCAKRCFEKAGCSAFYEYSQSCTFIMGYGTSEDDTDPEYYDDSEYTDYGYDSNYTDYGFNLNEYDPESISFNSTDYYYSELGERSQSISDLDLDSAEFTTVVKAAGKLSNLCPQNAFKNTYKKKSQFYCLLFAPNGAESLVDDIVESNTGNANTPLNVWTFKKTSANPYTTSSQYVDVSLPNMGGTNRRYRPIIFTIETHIRVANQVADGGRKRRSADRTVDILDEINSIEQQALNFILEGGMNLPAGIKVAVTGDVETVEIVQTAADGSVAADCSSGSCQCSDGFIDIGNGCEQMTEEQAAEPTDAPVATQTLASDPVKDWIQSLVDKMEAVFEDFRPERPYPALLKKWSHQAKKFVRRYERVVAHGCEFPGTFDDAAVDFNTINTCRVSTKTSGPRTLN